MNAISFDTNLIMLHLISEDRLEFGYIPLDGGGHDEYLVCIRPAEYSLQISSEKAWRSHSGW